MEINNLKNTYSNNFASRKLFAATLCQKVSDGVKKPVNAFISELTSQDLGRADLRIRRWGRTKFGADILEDFRDWYSPQLFDEYTALIPNTEYKFFAVETPSLKDPKAVSIAKVKVLDDIIVLDRLQTLVKTKKAKKRMEGAGSGILYAVADLADKLKKQFVFLESHEKAKGFYKKAGLTSEQRGDLCFYKLYQSKYKEFLETMGKKLGIKPVE